MHANIPASRLELRAPPGSYRLHLSLGREGGQEVAVEMGAPSEQVIELDVP